MTKVHEFNLRKLLEALVHETEVDMDQIASVEAMNAMEAYYKVGSTDAVVAVSMY